MFLFIFPAISSEPSSPETDASRDDILSFELERGDKKKEKGELVCNGPSAVIALWAGRNKGRSAPPDKERPRLAPGYIARSRLLLLSALFIREIRSLEKCKFVKTKKHVG